jgi:hypothetical protein
VAAEVAIIGASRSIRDDLEAVKIDLAVIRATCMTKADLQKAMFAFTWKMVGFGTLPPR